MTQKNGDGNYKTQGVSQNQNSSMNHFQNFGQNDMSETHILETHKHDFDTLQENKSIIKGANIDMLTNSQGITQSPQIQQNYKNVQNNGK